MTTVLDASFTVDWLATASHAPLDGMVVEASGGGFQAPVIFWHEVASALRSLVFRNQITRPLRDEMLETLRRLRVELDQPVDIDRVVRVSESYNLSIYDAAYLELAVRRGADLATTDKALVQAGRAAGLKVLTL